MKDRSLLTEPTTSSEQQKNCLFCSLNMPYNPFIPLVNWFDTTNKAKGALVSMGIATLLLFIMSMTQINQQTDTGLRSDSEMSDICTDDYIQYTRPFKFMQTSINTEYGPFICPWPSSLSVYRSLISVFCIIHCGKMYRILEEKEE